MKLKLRRLFDGTPARPPLAPHPLDEPEPVVDLAQVGRGLAQVGRDITARLAEGIKDAAQCTATTSKGARCKNPPQPGTDRCVLPSHQRTS